MYEDNESVWAEMMLYVADPDLWPSIRGPFKKRKTGNPMAIKWSLEWSQNHMVRKATNAMGIS